MQHRKKNCFLNRQHSPPTFLFAALSAAIGGVLGKEQTTEHSPFRFSWQPILLDLHCSQAEHMLAHAHAPLGVMKQLLWVAWKKTWGPDYLLWQWDWRGKYCSCHNVLFKWPCPLNAVRAFRTVMAMHRLTMKYVMCSTYCVSHPVATLLAFIWPPWI